MDNRQTERTPRKCFRCGSEYNLITKFLKPPKENGKQQNKVHYNEKSNRVCDNGKNNSDRNIYAYMARMSENDEFPSGNFGDSSQLTNWILDSGAMCHMKPDVLDFFQVRQKIQINTLKFRTEITSRRNKKDK